ncbi:hypothetical protein FSOLCH5_013322 [Fusarium solani]
MIRRNEPPGERVGQTQQSPNQTELQYDRKGTGSFRDADGRSECADYWLGGSNGPAAAREEKKGKAVPNPNRRLMALAEALAAEEALPVSKEAEIEVGVDEEAESVIEVGDRSEDESEEFMVVRKNCQHTRSGRELKNLRRVNFDQFYGVPLY